ncbi:hypothetical protein HYPSUDRAFT_192512 [Hypholoma sublateritium FD-334 SS-4]|uniref:Wax synthase domain-containing protein n=1 Tax=Hypholoma sublateritium (strain FD-334 SS-4) TaxID=945553 RepID=A0A0D2NDX9_HYPSF|nr:hypothetical protein HYPSUDRAFT_192512 [Hypholoma sublateritium FD-334 SS-4]
MLIVFLLFALFRLPKGAPLTDNHVDTPELIGNGQDLLPRADITFGTRQTSDIVISCLATIFACTWTAVHPNIPSPMDSRWDLFKRRFVTTIYALLAPEFITAWALRQYIGAKVIVRIYNSKIATPRRHTNAHHHLSLWSRVKEWLLHAPPLPPPLDGEIRPWTITHGFFVQMGGFMLCENGIPSQTAAFKIDEFIPSDLSRLQWDLGHLILSGEVDPPRIAADEINDRSKGDTISKGVVIFQTTWFTIQCFARWSAHISVTELEVLTLAFAMLNGITYALWWNKPQNVDIPVYLEKRESSLIRRGTFSNTEYQRLVSEEDEINSLRNSEQLSYNEIPPLPALPTTLEGSVNMESQRTDSVTMLGTEDAIGIESFNRKFLSQKDTGAASKSYGQGSAPNFEKAGNNEVDTILKQPIPAALPPLVPSTTNPFRQPAALRPVRLICPKQEDTPSSVFSRLRRLWPTTLTKCIGAAFSMIQHLISQALHPLAKLGRSSPYQPFQSLRVAMFFAESTKPRSRPAIERMYLSMISLLFGCTHFIPSFFLYYRSRPEMWLWWISAGIIIFHPLVYFIVFTVFSIAMKRNPLSALSNTFITGICAINRLVITRGMVFYIIARIILIVLSFLSLRHLPDDVFVSINWVSSIPHL